MALLFSIYCYSDHPHSAQNLLFGDFDFFGHNFVYVRRMFEIREKGINFSEERHAIIF